MSKCGCKSKGLEVKIKKLNENAVIPTYSNIGDAGMDLTAISIKTTNEYIEYDTGLAFSIPEGYVGLVFPRSSNSKKDLLQTNSVGVIDSTYRGSVSIRHKIIYNNANIKDNPIIYSVGERVAQIMIIPYPQINFIEVDELDSTIRGIGGFGSTGA